MNQAENLSRSTESKSGHPYQQNSLIDADSGQALVCSVAVEDEGTSPEAEHGEIAPAVRSKLARAEDGGQARSDQEETYCLVLRYLERHRIVILFSGYCYLDGGVQVATSPGDVDEVLSREEISADWVCADFLMEMKAAGRNISASDARRAVHKAFARAKITRRKQVLTTLLDPLPDLEKRQAEKDWGLLSSIFEMDESLCGAIFGHYIWQVKQKALNRRVTHHLMPVIVSALQGSGKTTFALEFLNPLRELANGPVLLSDFSDERSRDIYRFPATLIDDVGRIPAKKVADLKSLVTSDTFNRRVMRTSDSVTVKQRTTLLGTANSSIEELIPDASGHRRFVNMPFRNGVVEKGGDVRIWRIVKGLDYTRLWRSIDAYGPSPIDACLDALYAWQAASAPSSPIYKWLCGLDLGSEEILRITSRSGVGANELYEAYLRDSGAAISSSLFGREVKRLLKKAEVPFGEYVRLAHGRYYKIKVKNGE